VSPKNPHNTSTLAQAVVILHQVGRKSCEIVSTAFVTQPPLCTKGNEDCGVSAGSSIVETVGSILEEPEAEHHLHVEKAHDSLWSYSNVVLSPRMGYPLRRGTNED
jgi:hypothetical protein